MRQRAGVLTLANSERFVDQAPASIVATLLEEGAYRCSVRTMYRILAAAKQVRPRRQAPRRPRHARPELMATGPRQVGRVPTFNPLSGAVSRPRSTRGG